MQVGRRERNELREQIRAEVRGSEVYKAVKSEMDKGSELLCDMAWIKDAPFSGARHSIYKEFLGACDKMFEYALYGSIVL